MTTPAKSPPGYQLSAAWWAGDTPRTEDEFWHALGVLNDLPGRQAAAKRYYRQHPERAKYVPNEWWRPG